MPEADERISGRLARFLSRFARVAFSFAACEAVLTLIARDWRIASAGLITFSFAVVAFSAERAARRGAIARAALTTSFAVLLAAALHVIVVPQAFPALVLVPIVAVATALPYAKGTGMRTLFGSGWTASVGIALAGVFLPSPAFDPPWFGSAICVTGTGAIAFLISHLQADFVAQTTEHRRAIEQQNATLSFLADSSAIFAETLELEATLTRAARIAVPFLSDWCWIDVIDERGAVRRVASRHDDPAKDAVLRTIESRYPLSIESAQPAAVALQTKAPYFVSNLTKEGLAHHAVDPEQERLVGMLGTRSVLAVPIALGGKAAGALTFGSQREGRFSEKDVPLVSELARRIGLAVANARVHEMTRKAVQVREDFLSIAGHELRTPLTALKLHVEGLMKRAGTMHLDATFGERLEKSAKQVERLDALVAQLLDVTRIAAGRIELARESMDLSELAREVVERFVDVAVRGRSSLVLEANAPVVGNWDRARLDQVITNLLSNALKYGADQPVRVVVGATETYAKISVEDRGIGIAPDALERIFGRFERAVSERHYGGLGLGLWIVRNIVEAHGGIATVASTPNVRTAFTIELPYEANAA